MQVFFPASMGVDTIDENFLAAESTGRLAQVERETVQSNRSQVVKAA